MANGTWSDADLLFAAAGAEQRPITLRPETPGKVIITGASQLRLAGSYLVVEGLLFRDTTLDEVVVFRRSSKEFAHYCRLTNCAIVDCNSMGKESSRYVSLYGTHNRVDHCYLAGKKKLGTTLVVWVGDGPNQHVIDRNHFGHRPELKKNGGETIRVGTSDVSMTSSKTLVETNYFEECDGETEIISNKSCDNTYRGNTFVRCAGALTLRHGNRCLVEGNYFLGQHAKRTGGVRIIGEDHRVVNNYFEGLEGDDARSAISLMAGLPNSPLSGYFQVKRATVAGNTVVDCKHPLVVGVTDKDTEPDLPPTDCTITKNLLVGRGREPIEQPIEAVRTKWIDNQVMTQIDGSLPREQNGLIRPIAPMKYLPLGPADVGPMWLPAADRK